MEFEESEEPELHLELTSKQLIDILNSFIFRLFVVYNVLLNVLLLIVFPFFVKRPLIITADD